MCGAAENISASGGKVFACCSTVGPDYYADGALVRDGESYALVYTRQGEFAGFMADGSLVDAVNSEVVLVLAKAKGGRCPETLCVLGEDFVKARQGGVWELVLLDTRTASGSPTTRTAGARLRRVNRWGKTDSSVVFSGSPTAPGDDGESHPVKAATLTALPEGLPQLVVREISKKGDTVSMKVSGTVGYMSYNVRGSDELSKLNEGELVAIEPKDGNPEGEIEIRANGAKVNFFQVESVR